LVLCSKEDAGRGEVVRGGLAVDFLMHLAHAVPGQPAPTVVLKKDAVQIDSRKAYLLEIGAAILIFTADHATLRK
jgi:hypothetical protein